MPNPDSVKRYALINDTGTWTASMRKMGNGAWMLVSDHDRDIKALELEVHNGSQKLVSRNIAIARSNNALTLMEEINSDRMTKAEWDRYDAALTKCGLCIETRAFLKRSE